MLLYIVRRLLWAVLIIFLTGVAAFAGLRILRPELYPGETLIGGTWRDLRKLFIDGDFGEACFMIGCPSMNDVIGRSWAADVFLIVGAMVLGVLGGVAGGIWCAARPRSIGARVLEGTAMFFFCAPVYVVGLSLLIFFAPPFGFWEFPFLFELHQYVSPFEDPWTFLRAMFVPWLITAAPIAAVTLRLTVASIGEVEHEDFVRTALAKGLSRPLAIRRHAAPASYVPVASFVGVAMPALIANMVLVEIVMNVPGVFRFTKRAIEGHDPPGPVPDYPSLQIIAIYGALFIVLFTILADIALAYADPRIREGGRRA